MELFEDKGMGSPISLPEIGFLFVAGSLRGEP